MNFFQLIATRWKSESPKLFIRIQNFGIGLVSAGTAGIAIPQIPGVVFPPIINQVSGYLIVAGFCIGVISKLTCQDTSKIDQSTTKV
jgi:hypothetical protein